MNIHQEINLKLWKISAESKAIKIPQTWKPDKTTDYSEKLRSFAAVSVILSQLFKSIHPFSHCIPNIVGFDNS